MESFGLNEEDLSLFGGDLLVNVGAPVETEPSFGLGVAPEGCHTTAKMGMELKQAEGVYQIECLVMESHEEQQSIHKDPFDFLGNSWLDAKVDLLEALGSSDLIGLEAVSSLPPSSVCSDDDVKDLVALHPVSLDMVADQTRGDMELLQSFAQVPGTPEDESPKWPMVPVDKAQGDQPEEGEVDDSGLMEVLAELSNAIGLSIDDQMETTMLDAQPALSPVSIEDIESLLSSSPASPTMSPCPEESSAVESNVGPVKASTSRGRRHKPYKTDYECDDEFVDTSQIKDKKLRKKMQNKNAALRYRQKKKAECGGMTSECDLLEERNKELNDKVDSMTREIQYLKDLLGEVYKAKEKSKA